MSMAITFVRTHPLARARAHTHARTHARTHTHTHTHTHTGSNPVEGKGTFFLIPSALSFVFLWHTHAHARARTHTHTHTHTHARARARVRTRMRPCAQGHTKKTKTLLLKHVLLEIREHLVSSQFFSKRNAFQIDFTPPPPPSPLYPKGLSHIFWQ